MHVYWAKIDSVNPWVQLKASRAPSHWPRAPPPLTEKNVPITLRCRWLVDDVLYVPIDQWGIHRMSDANATSLFHRPPTSARRGALSSRPRLPVLDPKKPFIAWGIWPQVQFQEHIYFGVDYFALFFQTLVLNFPSHNWPTMYYY